jgi:PAS domain S-box-containing protein
MNGSAHDGPRAGQSAPASATPQVQQPPADPYFVDSEARLRAIYDGTHEYIGLVAPDGTVLDCNQASLQFAGNTRDEIVGLPLWEAPWFAYTPGAPERLRGALSRAVAGEFVRHHVTLQRPSGEAVTFDFSLHPVRDEAGEVVFIVPEGRDITEQQRAQSALSESESRYRALFDSIDQGFCVVEVLFDDDGVPVDYRFEETNPAFIEQTGLKNAVGRTARELVPGLEQHWFETYGRVARTGEAIRFESGSDSMGRWFDVFAFRVGAPEECRVSLLFSDVSAAHAAAQERDRLMAALEVERSRLKEVFHRAPSFIVAFRGADHVYEFVNEAYYQLVGQQRDLLGRPFVEALPEIRDQGYTELLDRVLETGEPWVGRETPARLQRDATGPAEMRYLDMVFQAMTEADGTRSGIVAHGYDVTEQVVARQEVERLLAESERSRDEAQAANLAKSEFLAVMSHELRTPLNAISGYADLLSMGIHGPVTEAQLKSLERIQLSQRHLLGLINEVLNYAKLETGTVEYDTDDIPLADAVIGAESLVAPQARAKHLSLVVVECPADLLVRADSEKLRQILVNLLSNSVKFTPAGGRIEVACAREQDSVTITVSDTGIGIPEHKLDSIFDPFVQVRADLSRPHEGAGLGLAISRDLARGMGGSITARSKPGAGSTFTVSLPAA